MKHQHLSKTQAAKTNQSPQTATNTTSDAHPVLQMQADIGNRATSHLLSSQKPIQAKPLFGGLSSELSIQPKLTIGAVGDKYEQEADTVASQVVNRINSPAALTVQREEMLPEDEELMMKPTVQRYSDNQESVAATPDLEASIQQSRGGGEALPDDIRQPMEQEFGADFSGVKVHANSQADKLNSAIQAKAFTTRQDIFFKQGEYNPNTRGGKELLAHELTHVVQQNGGEVQGQVSRQISEDTIQRVDDDENPILQKKRKRRNALTNEIYNNQSSSGSGGQISQSNSGSLTIPTTDVSTHTPTVTSTSGQTITTTTTPNNMTPVNHNAPEYTKANLKPHKDKRVEMFLDDHSVSHLFRKFCETEFSVENFDFYQAIMKYFDNPSMDIAEIIIKLFIEEGSKLEVNISGKNLKYSLLQAYSNKNINLISEALIKLHECVMTNLNDTFSRFEFTEKAMSIVSSRFDKTTDNPTKSNVYTRKNISLFDKIVQFYEKKTKGLPEKHKSEFYEMIYKLQSKEIESILDDSSLL
jgi:Domain of unknown function (DUF4157)/Regulator of G protein signaling domain